MRMALANTPLDSGGGDEAEATPLPLVPSRPSA